MCVKQAPHFPGSVSGARGGGGGFFYFGLFAEEEMRKRDKSNPRNRVLS